MAFAYGQKVPTQQSLRRLIIEGCDIYRWSHPCSFFTFLQTRALIHQPSSRRNRSYDCPKSMCFYGCEVYKNARYVASRSSRYDIIRILVTTTKLSNEKGNIHSRTEKQSNLRQKLRDFIFSKSIYTFVM